MKGIDTVVQAVSRDDIEEARKKVERTTEVRTHDKDTIRYIEKKLADKGVHRMERHPSDGIGIRPPPHKSGHGGKYTWEGPGGVVESELCPSPPAIDEKDPNYVDEEEEEKIVKGEDGEVSELVVGEVEVPKAEEIGVARVDVDPKLRDVSSE